MRVWWAETGGMMLPCSRCGRTHAHARVHWVTCVSLQRPPFLAYPAVCSHHWGKAIIVQRTKAMCATPVGDKCDLWELVTAAAGKYALWESACNFLTNQGESDRNFKYARLSFGWTDDYAEYSASGWNNNNAKWMCYFFISHSECSPPKKKKSMIMQEKVKSDFVLVNRRQYILNYSTAIVNDIYKVQTFSRWQL